MQCNSVTDALADADSDAWTFAVDIYGRPGVRESCLALQDRRGADVVAMLVLLHRAAQGHPVPRLEALAALLEEVAAWRRAAVLPLRAIRREMKQAMFPGEMAPGLQAERVRQAVAAAELAAERVELDHLARRLAQASQPGGGQPGGGQAEEAGRGARDLSGIDLLELYGRAAGLAFEAADRQDLAILAAAALPDPRPRTAPAAGQGP